MLPDDVKSLANKIKTVTKDLIELERRREEVRSEQTRLATELAKINERIEVAEAEIEALLVGNDLTSPLTNGTIASSEEPAYANPMDLRNKILESLNEQGQVHIRDLARKVNEPDRKKLAWILVKMRQRGQLLNPSRGYWEKAKSALPDG